VKEWVGKRGRDTDEESGDDDPTYKKKMTPTKNPVIVANAKGVLRVDPKQVPNLSSGKYGQHSL